jgi:hypothetical protein
MSANLINFPPGPSPSSRCPAPDEGSRSPAQPLQFGRHVRFRQPSRGHRPAIPRSPAISRWVRPLVRASRTASSSNSCVNRRCCIIEFLTPQRELATFLGQVQGLARRALLTDLSPAPYANATHPRQRTRKSHASQRESHSRGSNSNRRVSVTRAFVAAG